MGRANLVLCLVTVALVMGWCDPAKADEGESTFSVSVSYAGFSLPELNPVGGEVGMAYEHGITDVIWLRGFAAGGTFWADDDQRAQVGRSTLGVSYYLDVLKYVPHIDLGAGFVYIHGLELERAVEPMIELGGGFDVLTRPGRSYGVFARYESFLSRSAYFTVGARMTWRWGFF